MLRALIIGCICLAATISCCQQPGARFIYQKLQECTLPAVRGAVLCGSYPVIENRQTGKGRTIQLNIVVIPALRPDSLRAPIFDIEGGPGLADTKNAGFYADSSNPYRRYHDIVLIDVRGTGKSNGLYCSSLQDKNTWEDVFREQYPADKVRECYLELSKRADLRQYNTTNVVMDFEDVRKWLGYKEILLFSLSYGTRVALRYMKMYPSSIKGAVLWSPAPAYAKIPLYHARFAQNTIEKLVSDCKRDSLCAAAFPKFETELYSLYKRAKAAPLKVSFADAGGNKTQQLVSWDMLFTRIRQLMYRPQELRTIPLLVHQLYNNNFSVFIKSYPPLPDTSTVHSEGFYLCVTCTEDVPFIKAEEISRFTEKTFMGTYRIRQQQRACENWVRGSLPEDFFEPVRSGIPVLILTGSFDPVTPPSMAREIASHLPNSTIVEIPAMSHMLDGLAYPQCFDNIAVRFLANPANPQLDLECIKKMLPAPYKVKE